MMDCTSNFLLQIIQGVCCRTWEKFYTALWINGTSCVPIFELCQLFKNSLTCPDPPGVVVEGRAVQRFSYYTFAGEHSKDYNYLSTKNAVIPAIPSDMRSNAAARYDWFYNNAGYYQVCARGLFGDALTPLQFLYRGYDKLHLAL